MTPLKDTFYLWKYSNKKETTIKLCFKGDALEGLDETPKGSKGNTLKGYMKHVHLRTVDTQPIVISYRIFFKKKIIKK